MDEFESERPQRHNIVFADGWPTNEWYSTRALREKHNSPGKAHDAPKIRSDNFQVVEDIQNQAYALNGITSSIMDEISGKIDSMTSLSSNLGQEISNAISQALSGRSPEDTDIDEICSDIMDKFSDKIDAITDEITQAFDCIDVSVQEMTDAIENIGEE